MKCLQAALPGTLLVFALLLGCNSSSESPDRKSSATQRPGGPSDQGSGSSGIADAILDQTDADNPKVSDSDLPDDLNELMAALARKEMEQTRAQNEKEFFGIQQFRAGVCRDD